MKTYKCKNVLNKLEVIESLLNSAGYQIMVEEDNYHIFQVGDKVIFANVRINQTNLYGTIRRKHQQPSPTFRKNTDNVEYVFAITFDARVNLELDNVQ